MQRVNESLIDRGYVTWFDLTNMKGEYYYSRVLSLTLLGLCPPCARVRTYVNVNACVCSLNTTQNTKQAVQWTP
jgi:hypothetical protein